MRPMEGSSSTFLSQSKSSALVVTDEDTTTMDCPQTLASGNRNSMNGKVKELINLYSSSQTHSIKRRLRKRTEISDFDSMGDEDEAADYALMQEEEKLMLKEEHAASRRFDAADMIINSIQNKAVNDANENESSYIPSLNHAIASMEGKKEIKQISKRDNHGAGVWLGTRGRKLIGKPLPPPPTILVKIPEVANPIIGGTSICSSQTLELKGPSTTINTILSFKRGPPNLESVPNPILPANNETKDEAEAKNEIVDVGTNHLKEDMYSHPPNQLIAQESCTALNHSLPLIEETKADQCEEEFTTTGRKYSVSFSITESRDMIHADNTCSNSSSLPVTRKRLYSIDIDCKSSSITGKGISVSPWYIHLLFLFLVTNSFW